MAGAPDARGGDEVAEAARRLADEVLAPAAQATDQASSVPLDHLHALADAGLCGIVGPPAYGGRPVAAPVRRQVFETLAGACGVTFFVWVQHLAPVRLLTTSANATLAARWLPELCRGTVLGGVAFAYLRRPGPPAVVARRVAGGWRVDGEAPYVTSWGLARLFTVLAVIDDDGSATTDAGEALYFVLDAEDAGPSVQPSPPLLLAAMGASATVRLVFDGHFVPDDDVVRVIELDRWRQRDRAATSQPHPAPLGLATTAIRLLATHGDSTGQVPVGRAADDLAAELESCRTRAYALSDQGRHDDDHLALLVEARAWSLDLAMRSAQALVAATGGGAMALDHPAQRLLREAAFWSIQAQSSSLRELTLDRLAARYGGPR